MLSVPDRGVVDAEVLGRKGGLLGIRREVSPGGWIVQSL